VKEVLAQYPALVWTAYIAVIGGVLAGGLLANHGKTRARVLRIWSMLQPRLLRRMPGRV